jgi:uncharacterized membrane protein
MTERAPISVVAVFYRNESEASAVLQMLNELHGNGAAEILDAALIVRDRTSGRLKIAEGTAPANEERPGRGVAGIIARIFPPSILGLEAVGRPARTAQEHFAEEGFDANLLKEIGENLTPEGAALIAVIEETWLEKLTGTIQGRSDVLRYGLDARASRRLRERDL